MPDMVPSLNTDLKIEMPREVFDKMAQLIDTVCSQQDVIAQQQSVINKVLNPHPRNEASVDGADSEGNRGASAVG